jgi:long-chain acyl-CoA synthetase
VQESRKNRTSMINDILPLDKLLQKRAHLTPGRTFIKFDGHRFTFSDVERMAESYASFLLKKGIRKNDKIAILSGNCPEYIAVYMGILRAGGIAVPINTLLSPDEITFIFKDSETFACFYHKNLDRVVAQLRSECKVVFLELNELPMTGGAASSPRVKNYADEVSTMLYTSGTTGYPKGAMLTHINIVSNALASLEAIDISHKDIFLVFLPLSHSFTFTVCVVIPLVLGARISLLESVKPFSRVIKRIIADRITLFVAIPMVYSLLSRKKVPFFFKYLLKVRLCISGAAPLSLSALENFERVFGIPLLEGYGLTEAAPVVAVNRCAARERKNCTVGPPLPGVEVRIVDDDGKLLPAGSQGELLVKGPNVMKGYFNKPEETAGALKDGWLYTGDIAVLDEEGHIRIVDRKKDMIIIDGLNVYPGEVENVAYRYQAIEECAMVGLEMENCRELPVMFVVLKKDQRFVEREFKSFLSRHVASYKVPRRIIPLDEMPRNPTGKISKKELRKWKIN